MFDRVLKSNDPHRWARLLLAALIGLGLFEMLLAFIATVFGFRFLIWVFWLIVAFFFSRQEVVYPELISIELIEMEVVELEEAVEAAEPDVDDLAEAQAQWEAQEAARREGELLDLFAPTPLWSGSRRGDAHEALMLDEVKVSSGLLAALMSSGTSDASLGSMWATDLSSDAFVSGGLIGGSLGGVEGASIGSGGLGSRGGGGGGGTAEGIGGLGSMSLGTGGGRLVSGPRATLKHMPAVKWPEGLGQDAGTVRCMASVKVNADGTVAEVKLRSCPSAAVAEARRVTSASTWRVPEGAAGSWVTVSVVFDPLTSNP